MYEVPTRTERQPCRGLVHDDGAVVTHTGLSVITRGHLMDVVRYEVAKVAVVRVIPVDSNPLQVDLWDLKVAADTFAERVGRLLGSEWDVVGWEPPHTPETNAVQSPKGKVAGYIDEPWRTGI